ncbi:hypothetical protein RI367_001605 [Sorochytrium milnesiophthora]
MRFTLIALVAFAALAVEVTASPILSRRGADNEFKLRARSPAGNDKLAQIEALLTKAFGAAGNIGKVASDVVGVVNDVSGGNVAGAITDGINGAKDIAGALVPLLVVLLELVLLWVQAQTCLLEPICLLELALMLELMLELKLGLMRELMLVSMLVSMLALMLELMEATTQLATTTRSRPSLLLPIL